MKKFITKLSGYLIIASVYPIVMVMASGIAENPGLYVYHFPVWSITLTALNLIIIGAVVVVSADVQKSPIKIINTMNIQEELARLMYDKYCESVGGVAFNGDKLPTSDEFFNDETKSKQANAWRDVSFMAIRKLIHN